MVSGGDEGATRGGGLAEGELVASMPAIKGGCIDLWISPLKSQGTEWNSF